MAKGDWKCTNYYYSILKKNYPILQAESRKINTLTILVHESMKRCKKEIEELRVMLEAELK